MIADHLLQWLALLAMGAGVLLMLIAGLGILRMPDLYLRLHCATKSATLGVGLLVVGVALWRNEYPVWVRCLVVIVFLLLTSPVGAQMIGRAAHRARVPMARETLSDDLAAAEAGRGKECPPEESES
ncbi:MAG: monovalent cation/H(+) antiporter subunit G [Candidatus Competibacteraceae bacterium]|nr:monovalent cation/H(+) antiporter subunit G [Candidatus Competibacteraceae bacterium]